MALSSSPNTQLPQPQAGTPESIPVVFHALKATFDQGELHPDGYNALYKVLEKIDALNLFIRARFVHRTMSWDEAKLRVSQNATFICTVIQQFTRTYKEAMGNIEGRLKDLPVHAADLDGPNREGNMRFIEDLLAQLPGPRPQHKNFCKMIAEYYWDTTYHPFIQFHREYPGHKLWDVNEHLATIHHVIEELYSSVVQAHDFLKGLKHCREEFAAAILLDQKATQSTSAPAAENIDDSLKTSADPERSLIDLVSEATEILASARRHSHLPWEIIDEPQRRLNARISAKGTSESFGAIEERLRPRQGGSENLYTTDSMAKVSVGEPQFGSVGKRKGIGVPRFFNRSLDNLESVSNKTLAADSCETTPNLISRQGSAIPSSASDHPARHKISIAPGECHPDESNATHSPGRKEKPLSSVLPERARARTFDDYQGHPVSASVHREGGGQRSMMESGGATRHRHHSRENTF